MSQTTTQLGRLKVLHPDLGFDTDDGGVALHAALVTAWTQVSNHIPSRWTGSVTLADTASTSVTHNFNLALTKLKILIFEAGVQLSDAQVTAAYTITQTSVDIISIQNTSGGSKTFNALIFAFKLGVTTADLDPGVALAWDTTLGTVPTFVSVYKNGNYTHSGATEYYDLHVIGNLTLSANIIVHGNLFVTGQIIAAGFSLTVKKDAIAIGGANISGASLTHSIGGNFFCAANVTIKNTSGAAGNVNINGDFIATDGATLFSLITADAAGVTVDANNVKIRGSVVGNIYAYGSADAVNQGGNGGIVWVGGDVNGGINTSGGAGGNLTDSGNGGAITVYGSVNGTISSAGADGDEGLCGNGGNILIHGDVSAPAAGIDSYGGTNIGIGDEDGGNAGTVTVNGNVSTGTAGVRSYGGDGQMSTGTTSNGGNAGAIAIKGSCTTQVADVDAHGGSARGLGRNGAAVTINGYCTASNVKTNGGTSGASGSGGSGGVITLRSGAKASLDSGGRGGSTAAGGTGGAINCDGSLDAQTVSASGGSGASNAAGGNGGAIIITGNVACIGGFTSNGGGGNGSGSAGNGGAITISGNFTRGNMSTNGGALTSGSGTAVGGSSGAITIYGDYIGGNISSKSGGHASGTSTGTGGNGGNITIYGKCYSATIDVSILNAATSTTVGTPGTHVFHGDVRVSAAFNANSGTTAAATAGNGAQITCKSNLYSEGPFTSTGGVAATGGGPAKLVIKGDLYVDGDFTMRGGDVSAAGADGGSFSRSPTLDVGGDFVAGSSSLVTLRGGDASGGARNGGGGSTSYASPDVIIGGKFELLRISGADTVIRAGSCGTAATLQNAGPTLILESINVMSRILLNATSGAVVEIGRLPQFAIRNGGYIASIYAPVQATNPRTSLAAIWGWGGTTHIGTWDIRGSHYPSTYFQSKSFGLATTGSSPFFGEWPSCLVSMSSAPQQGGLNAGGTNQIRTPAGGHQMNMGQDSGGITIWNYRTFNNA